MFPVTYAMISRQGGRDYNEDSVGAEQDGERWCFVLADGLGGHGKGEVASGIAVTVSKKCFLEGREDLSAWFEEAQKSISEVQTRLHAESQMKTTMSAVELTPEKLRWGYIGDSRIYYFRKNRLVRRTLDHSVPQMLVNAGKLKEKQIRGHEDRNKLLRVLGTRYESVKYVIDIPVRREERQAFLLCSDGFWEWIDEKKMIRLLKKSHSAQEWLDLMTEEVVKNGRGNHMDNYSAAAILL